MRVRVQKWGNSLAVRIPSAFAADVKIEQDAEMDMTLERGEIVLRRIEFPEYRLDEMLAQINEENLHDEIDAGPAIGDELW